jgi:hypothetical protein
MSLVMWLSLTTWLIQKKIFLCKVERIHNLHEAPIVGYSLTFFSFLHGFDRKKCHNMLALILEPSILWMYPKFKRMWLVISYLGHESAFTLVVQYDKQLFLLLLIWCYKVLMPIVWMRRFRCRALTLIVKICFKPWKLV